MIGQQHEEPIVLTLLDAARCPRCLWPLAIFFGRRGLPTWICGCGHKLAIPGKLRWQRDRAGKAT